MMRASFFALLALSCMLPGLAPAKDAPTAATAAAAKGKTAQPANPQIDVLQDPNPQDRERNFSGNWLWAVGDDRFQLTLHQKGDHIEGSHNSQLHEGNKIDSSPANMPPSIVGDAHGPSVVVRFRSGTPGSAAYGHARITLRGRYLYWQLMDSTGEHYFPDNAVLIRQDG